MFCLGFVERISLFSDVLQRLSNLSKPEYAAVSLRARQLVLTRRQRSFSERTLSLVDSLLDYIERRQPLVGAGHSLLTVHSPTTAGTGAKPHHIPTPMTPVASFPPFGYSSGGGTAGAHSGLGTSSMALGMLTTNSFILHFVGDLDEVGDDSLIALLGHPLGQLRKLAFEIYVRRHYDRWGLHDLRVHCDGEAWRNPLIALPPIENEKNSNVWRQQQYRSAGMTPSRWSAGVGNEIHHNILQETSTANLNCDNTCFWGSSVQQGSGPSSSTQPLWGTLPNNTVGSSGTPTWRLASTESNTTPKSQHHIPGRPKYPDRPTGSILTSTVGGFNERFSHLPNSRTNENLPVGGSIFNLSHVGVRPILPTVCNETSDIETRMNDEEDQSRQRVNKLLAVWIHTSVLSREFLVDTCDL